jgi:hypothetical protein
MRSCHHELFVNLPNQICSLAVKRQVSAPAYIRDVRGSSRHIMVSHKQYDKNRQSDSNPPPGTDSGDRFDTSRR